MKRDFFASEKFMSKKRLWRKWFRLLSSGGEADVVFMEIMEDDAETAYAAFAAAVPYAAEKIPVKSYLEKVRSGKIEHVPSEERSRPDSKIISALSAALRDIGDPALIRIFVLEYADLCEEKNLREALSGIADKEGQEAFNALDAVMSRSGNRKVIMDAVEYLFRRFDGGGLPEPGIYPNKSFYWRLLRAVLDERFAPDPEKLTATLVARPRSLPQGDETFLFETLKAAFSRGERGDFTAFAHLYAERFGFKSGRAAADAAAMMHGETEKDGGEIYGI